MNIPTRGVLAAHLLMTRTAAFDCISTGNAESFRRELNELTTITDAIALLDVLDALPRLVALALHGAPAGEA